MIPRYSRLQMAAIWELMRPVLIGFVLAILTGSLALGQVPTTAPSVLEDYYDGPYGHFTHWSAVLPLPGPRNSLRYSVCNFDPKDGLYFKWEKADFGMGLQYPLPPGKCATASVDSENYHAEYDAPIIFTAHNEKKKAGAYTVDPKDLRPSSAAIQTFYARTGAANIVTFSIRVMLDQEKNAVYSIEWSQGIPSVGVGIQVTESVLQPAIRELEKQGVKVRYTKSEELVSEADRNSVTPLVKESNFLQLSQTEPRSVAARFAYKPTELQPVVSPIVLLDQDGRLIASLLYRSIK